MSERAVTAAEQEYLESLFWLYEAGLPMSGANLALMCDLVLMREDATISLEQLRGLGDRWGQANSLQVLGQLDLMDGDLDSAEADYREALQLTTELGAKEDQIMMRLRLVANSLAAIGKEFVRMSRSESCRNSTSANVVVPPLMMMLSPGSMRSAAARAMARFCGTLTSWLIANGMPTSQGSASFGIVS